MDRQILRHPVFQQLPQLLFCQRRRAQHNHADAVTVRQTVERLRARAGEQLRQTLLGHRFDHTLGEGLRLGVEVRPADGRRFHNSSWQNRARNLAMAAVCSSLFSIFI